MVYRESSVCRDGRHEVCGGYYCSCECHPGSAEDRGAATDAAIKAWFAELEEVVNNTGRHAGHVLRQVRRCVCCSCGYRYQGRLRAAKE
jgi:hypothetical protein